MKPRLPLPPDGYYRLKQAIDNPGGDRRRKYGPWYKLAKIPRGLYLVETQRHDLGVDGVECMAELRYISRAGCAEVSDRCGIPQIQMCIAALVEALVPEPRNFDTVTSDWFPFDARNVLKALVDSGVVTLDQIKMIRDQTNLDD